MLRLRTLTVLFLIVFTGRITAYPGKIIKQFKSPGSCPAGLVYDGKNLWISDNKEDKLFCIAPKDGNLIKSIPSPGFWPAGLAWDGKYLWNVDSKLKKIFKVDPENGSVLFSIDAPCENPEGLAWDGNTLWTCDSRSKEIMKLDLSDGTAVKILASPANNPQGLTFDGTYMWCSDRTADEIYMINPESGEVIIIIKSPGAYPRGLAYDGENLWNTDYQTDQVYQLVRQDKEIFKLDNAKNARITFTHEVKAEGKGKIRDLNVYIAIPEDMPQQQIINKNFNPVKYNSLKDKWAQSYAHFNYKDITSGNPVRSVMTIEARISDINYFIFPDKCGTLDDIPADIKQTYTTDGTKYRSSDPFITQLARKIVGTETNPYWIARKIFDYVRNTLEYKLEGGWNAAPVVLQRGTGSCSEYSFSFISLCRAAGLPARYVGSIVVRGDDASLDDVFHRWPQVYLPNYGWIHIDPQGGDKPLPRDRAMNIGHLPNRFLITTAAGGDSEYMGWYYNSNENYQTDPQVKVNIETFGEWEPLETSVITRQSPSPGTLGPKSNDACLPVGGN